MANPQIRRAITLLRAMEALQSVGARSITAAVCGAKEYRGQGDLDTSIDNVTTELRLAVTDAVDWIVR